MYEVTVRIDYQTVYEQKFNKIDLKEFVTKLNTAYSTEWYEIKEVGEKENNNGDKT